MCVCVCVCVNVYGARLRGHVEPKWLEVDGDAVGVTRQHILPAGRRRRGHGQPIRCVWVWGVGHVAQIAERAEVRVVDKVRARLERIAKEAQPVVARVGVECEHVRRGVEHHRRGACRGVDVGHLAGDRPHRDLEEEDACRTREFE